MTIRNMQVSIIIITYNTKELIQKSLDELFKIKQDLDWEIIFVDNNSKDGTKEYLKESQNNNNNIKIIFNNQNLGFAKAVNLGVKTAKGDYILLLNSDAFINQEQIKELLGVLELDSKIGIVAPQLLNTDGSIQPSFGNFPSIVTMIFYLLRLDKIFPWGMVVYPNSASWISAFGGMTMRNSDWVSGACILIKKQIFDKVGLFDENYFMGVEDIDFCYRVRLAGYKIMYIPQIKILHYHQYTSKKLSKKLAIIKVVNNSLMYFYRKFHPGSFLRYYVFVFLTGIKNIIQCLKIHYENHSSNK